MKLTDNSFSNKTQHRWTLWLVLGFILCLISRHLFSEGMFTDGIYYANIAHRLATHQCSCWHLSFSQTLFSEFYEHPPFALWIQSIFLTLFGDNFYIDKFFSFFINLCIGSTIWLCWRKLTGDSKSVWLPLLCWFLIPSSTWGVTNNVLESTMCLFSMLAIYFCLYEKHRYPYTILAGFMLFLSFLSKGPAGLFPLVFPFIAYIVERQTTFKQCVLQTAIFLGSFVAFMGIMFLVQPDSFAFFKNYFTHQIVYSTTMHASANRFYIIWRWFCEMLPLLGVLLLFFFFVIRKHKKEDNPQSEGKALRKKKLSLFLLGLAGVIPMMISRKQHGYYLLTTYPVFALSAALLVKTYYTRFFIGLKAKCIITYIVLTLGLSITLFTCGKPGRDGNILAEVHTFSKIIPQNSIVSITANDETNCENPSRPSPIIAGTHQDYWKIGAYLARYHDISLDENDMNHEYLLAKTPPQGRLLLENYHQLLNTYPHTLYKHD